MKGHPLAKEQTHKFAPPLAQIVYSYPAADAGDILFIIIKKLNK
jgi:hypothetical protein